MIKNIIATYLNITDDQADYLIKLISFEQRWQAANVWKGKSYRLAQITTQADFISYLQALGQCYWFKGHDYSRVSDNTSTQIMKDKYYTLFKGIGLIERVDYPADFPPPDFSLILGASQHQVLFRMNSFKEDVLAGLAPTENILYGLGCNRQLGVSVALSEEKSIQKLVSQNKNPTEMNMVSLYAEETLADLIKLDKKYEKLEYKAVDTVSNAKSREEKDCVKTACTALSLKNEIENSIDIKARKTPFCLASYSKQPMILRQTRDVQNNMGDAYQVIGVGEEYSNTDFNENLKSINLCLAELAKLININYSPANLKNFEVPLIQAELQELASLQQFLKIKFTADRNVFFICKDEINSIQNKSKGRNSSVAKLLR